MLSRLLAGHDIAVSAVRFVKYDPDMLLDAVRSSGVRRLAVVGGAGSLQTPNGSPVSETSTFPEAAKAEAAAGARMLERLRAETEIDWTFLSPSARFFAGARTKTFRVGADVLLVDQDGTSSISYEDYAVAFVDELENSRHSRRRFTVGY
jgi:putative NADH-flavin reductase